MPPATRARSARHRPRADLREAATATPDLLEPDAPAAPPPRPAPESSGAGPRIKTPLGSPPIIPVLLIMVGGYLAWFGVHYWRQDQRWPSDPIKSVLQGKGLPTSTPPPAVSASLTADIQQFQQPAASSTGSAASTGDGSAYQGALPAGAAQNTARLLLGKFGWAATEFAALNTLWGTDESGWNPKIRNPKSGAFGIAQALGHGTSCSAAADGTNEYGPQYGLTCAEAQQANAGSIRWQIEWGLGYIKSRYGSPTAALAHENAHHWY